MIDSVRIKRLEAMLRSFAWRNGSSQVKARAYLDELGLKVEPRWTYDLGKLVRNATLADSLAMGMSDGEGQGEWVQVGRFWESLSRLEGYRNPGSMILAALSYEVSGTSANSAAIIQKFRSANQATPIAEDPVLSAVESLLERKLLALKIALKAMRAGDYAKLGLASSGILEGVEELTEFLLSGDRTRLSSADETLDRVADVAISDGAVWEHMLANGVRRLSNLVDAHSIWSVLGEVQTSYPALWQRYLRLLARGQGRDLLSGRSVCELWPSQRAAVEAGLLGDGSAAMAIRMPTGAGKTRVAEMAMVKALADSATAKALYIAPFRALASELAVAFRRLFADLGFSVASSISSFDYDALEVELLNDADVAILTPERVDLLTRLDSNALNSVTLVVLDEGHILADEDRGVKTELLLTRLRAKLPNAKFIVASAMIDESGLREIARWLAIGAKAGGGTHTTSQWRPALQQLAKFEWKRGNGVLQFIDPSDASSQQFLPWVIRKRKISYVNEETQSVKSRTVPKDKADIAAELALRLSRLGPVLVYTVQPDWTTAIVARIRELVELDEELRPSWWGNIASGAGRAEQIARDWSSDDELYYLLSKGVAIHNGDLPDALKDAIERDARDGRFKIVVATSTLATGINIPIRSVIIHSWGRYENGHTSPMAASDYWNVVGRAGRAGFETEGLAVHIVAKKEDEAAYIRYLQFPRVGEQLRSRLLQIAQLLEKGIYEVEDAGALLDAEILPLMLEELDASELEKIISCTVDLTLAAQQTEDSTELSALKYAMAAQGRQILAEVPSASARLIFAQTGLASRDCLTIAARLQEDANIQSRLVEGTASEIATAILPIAFSVGELARIDDPSTVLRATLEWLDGTAVDEVLKTLMDASIERGKAKKIIDRYLRYYVPWYTSAVLRIAAFSLGDEFSTYSEECRLLPLMLRNGVPTVGACYAMSVGVPTRRTALIVSEASKNAVVTGGYLGFRRWISNVGPKWLASELDLHGPLLEDVLDALQSSGRRTVVLDSLRNDEILPRIARVQFAKRGAQTKVGLGTVLECRRAYGSLLDRNMIEVCLEAVALGRLGGDDERIVAAEMDAGVEVMAELVALDADDVRGRVRLFSAANG